MRQALTSLEGVESAEVSFEQKRAEVVYRPDEVGPDRLAEAVDEAGFEATLERGEDEEPRGPTGQVGDARDLIGHADGASVRHRSL